MQFNGFFLLLWWTTMAAVLAWIAQHRGEKPGFWFVLSLIASPMLAVLFLIAMPQKS